MSALVTLWCNHRLEFRTTIQEDGHEPLTSPPIEISVPVHEMADELKIEGIDGLTTDLQKLAKAWTTAPRNLEIRQFHRLLGRVIWPESLSGHSEPADIRLSFQTGDKDLDWLLASLPWEEAEPDTGRLTITRTASDGRKLAVFSDAPVEPVRMAYLRSSPLRTRRVREAGQEFELGPLGSEEDGLRKLERQGYAIDDRPQRGLLRTEDLEERIRDAQVLHITAHASGRTSELYWFDDDDSNREPPRVSKDLIPGAIRGARPDLRLVVLAGCDTDGGAERSLQDTLAQSIFDAGVPVVLGISGTIDDELARGFVDRFYAKLLHDGLDPALHDLREAWSRGDHHDYRLRVHSSLASGHLFGSRSIAEPVPLAEGPPRFSVQGASGPLVIGVDERGLHLTAIDDDAHRLGSSADVLVSPLGRTAAVVGPGTVRLATLDSRSGRVQMWADRCPLSGGGRAVATSDLVPGTGHVRLLVNGLDGTSILSFGPDGIGGSTQVAAQPCRTGAIGIHGAIAVLDDGEVAISGEEWSGVAAVLGSLADPITSIDAMSNRSGPVLLVRTVGDAAWVISSDGARPASLPAGSTLVRNPDPQAPLAALVPDASAPSGLSVRDA
jgi:hypothetical protein